MRKLALILLLLAICIPTSPLAAGEFKKTKIAVLDFNMQGNKGSDSDMGKIVAEWLITAFVRDGRFEVVERRLLESIINEQKLVMSGVVDTNNAEELGKLLGVKVIITGSIMHFQDMIEANARIIDVVDASIIAAESVKSSSASKLEDLVKEMAKKIIADFPLEGYVVRIKDSILTLDLGNTSGVKPGMRFSVFKEGAVIKHPKTGEVLDIERTQTALVEIVTVRDKISMAKVISQNDKEEIEYGQLVTSIAPPAGIEKGSSGRGGITVSAPPSNRQPVIEMPVAGTTSSTRPNAGLMARIASDVSATKVRAIKEVWSKKRSEPEIMALLADELQKGYQIKQRDKYHVDGMSWCCTILGARGDTKYADLLSTVSQNAPSDKLRAYAQKSVVALAKRIR